MLSSSSTIIQFVCVTVCAHGGPAWPHLELLREGELPTLFPFVLVDTESDDKKLRQPSPVVRKVNDGFKGG